MTYIHFCDNLQRYLAKHLRQKYVSKNLQEIKRQWYDHYIIVQVRDNYIYIMADMQGFCDGPIPRPQESYRVCVLE